MKILFVFSHPAPYKIDLFNGLAPHLDLTVVFERHASGYRHPLFYANETYKFRSIFLGGMAIGAENHFSRELIRHLKSDTYDLIIMNGYSSLTEIMTICYMQRQKIPYVLYVNGGVIHTDPKWRYRLKRKLVTGAFAYFSPTPHVDPYLIHYGAAQDKIIHYPYATIHERQLAVKKATSGDRNQLLGQLGLPPHEYFISAGQFVDRKNNMAVLKLWADTNRREHLLLVGSGPDENDYRRYIKDHDLRNVHILPYQKKSDLLPMIRHALGFIILSKEDIYGHVVNEALSQGVPVVSSDHVMAARHLIKNGRNGFIVDVADVNAVTQALDDVKKHDMFEACVATARDQTLEAMVAHHLDAFEALLP